MCIRDSREIIGAAEGMKEDKESWRSFFVWLKERDLTGVRLIIGDKNLGMLETVCVIPTDEELMIAKDTMALV